MLKISKFLQHFENIKFLIRDEEDKIIYPLDTKDYNFFKKVTSSDYDDNGYYIFEGTYYDHNAQVIIDEGMIYEVETLTDVSKYVKENMAALTDEVTNLGGKRITFQLFDEFISQSISLNRPFVCVMADADNFKLINDNFGHGCGDEMLKALGTKLYENTRHKNLRGSHICRGKDIVGRIGGEEFLLVFNNDSLVSTYNLVNKIRKDIEKSTIIYDGDEIRSCTMSFGMHYVDQKELQSYAEEDTLIDEIRKEILKKCDTAMYVSKLNGKNCINIYGVSNKEELSNAMFTRIKKEPDLAKNLELRKNDKLGRII